MNPQGRPRTGRPRSRGAAWGLIATVLVIHFAALALAPSIPSHRALFIVFFCTMVLAPGFLFSILIVPETNAPRRVLLSFVLGTAFCYVVLLAFAIWRWDLRNMAFAVWGAAVPLFFIGDRVRRTVARSEATAPERPAGIPRAAGAVLLLAILAAVLLVSLHGDRLLYTSDSPDHIAYLRTISRTHEAFPERFLYRDGGTLTRDIRKGLGDALWGTLNVLTGRTDAYSVWPLLSIIGSGFIILAVFCAAASIFGSAATGVIAALLFLLVYHGGLAANQLVTIAYDFPFGKIFYVSFMAFLLRYFSSRSGTDLFLASAAALAATGTHINHLVLIGFIVAVFSAVGILSARSGARLGFVTGRIVPLGAAVLLANLPYLALRYLRDYHPNNVIHSHLQAVLFITDRFYCLNPIIFYSSAGSLFVLSLVSAILLWRRARSDEAVRSLSWGTIAVLAVVMNPLIVPFLMHRLSYLVTRLDFAVPSMLLPAYLVTTLGNGLRGSQPSLGRGRAVIGWTALLVFAGYPVLMTPSRFAYSARSAERAQAYSALRLEDLYGAVNETAPGGSVVASDPVTSYCIPAFTDCYVACTLDQHSIPNDSTALERILDMREVFRTGAAPAHVAGILRRYGASYLLINGRIPPDLSPMYWKPDRRRAEEAIGRFKAAGYPYSLRYEHDAAALFAFTYDPSRPIEAEPPAASPYLGETVTAGEAAACTESGLPDIRIRRVTLGRTALRAGDTLSVRIEWVALRPCDPQSYAAFVRFDGEFERGLLYREWYGKVYRKLRDRIRGERHRFTAEHLPLGGVLPPDLWPPLRVISDQFTVRIPGDLSPGRFTVGVKLVVRTQYPNYVLGDFLSDKDVRAGAAVARLTVRSAEAEP